MRSFLRRARLKLLAPILLLAAVFLSACSTIGPTTLFAPQCFTELATATGLNKPTPHASIPLGSTAGEWVDYGNREGGQLDKSNAEKDAVFGIGETCDRWNAEAKKRVERKPFLKRVFGG